ncbi:MAG TPA: PIN domain-containing protein, partial [Dokdonella sp.]|nr:PIN domain-containing protein [Dokdonella sp.]
MTRGKRIYVLDTNVLMHDPTSLFRFEEHDVFIPMTVLEELDAAKKGQSEVSRNARQVSRFINELIENDKQRKIADGLDLRLPQGLRLDQNPKVGRLHFQTQAGENGNGRKRGLPDNLILASVVALCEAHPEVPVVLVTKDINLRIKASIAGITAEDYENDRALDDFSLLYAGHNELLV